MSRIFRHLANTFFKNKIGFHKTASKVLWIWRMFSWYQVKFQNMNQQCETTPVSLAKMHENSEKIKKKQSVENCDLQLHEGEWYLKLATTIFTT